MELIDVYPTIMEFLGLEIPSTVQGKSFWRTAEGTDNRHRDIVYSENDHAIMRFDGKMKFIYYYRTKKL